MLIALSSVVAVSAADPVIPPPCPTCGPGGAISAYNFTTNRLEFWPQCFPYVWYTSFQAGNLGDMYKNQIACREARKIDFRMN